MNKVYLRYEDHTSGGCALSDEEYSNLEDEYVEFYPRSLHTQAGNWSEEINVDFDPAKLADKAVFLVHVRYSTGSTFGHSYGHWEVIGVYATRNEAAAVVKSIGDDSYSGYKCWNGYFDSLESAELDAMVLEDSKCPNSNLF
jgi:hypothetical protein